MSTTESPPSKAVRAAEANLCACAGKYPDVVEEAPWGHRAFKIKNKSFVFMAASGEELSISVKLPMSRDIAVSMPFAEPTGYGLGKSGWVTASFALNDSVPFEILEAWIDESFRAIAPKKVVASLGEPAARIVPASGKKPVAKKAVAKKSVAKKPVAKKKR